MNIVIAASQVPFVRGGAEVLVDGLSEALERRGHRVAVVALPFKWYPKEQLLRTALAWRLLDLTEANGVPIDRVICTKFPTWAVRHPHKVAWLVHQHRQAYDWFGTPLSDFSGSPEDRDIRRRVRGLDRVGLGECRARFAISRNVAARLERFTGLRATALYPPVRLTGLCYAGDDGTVLSVARLDAAKRLDLLLEALALTREPVRIVLAGSGPDEAKLRGLAARLGIAERVAFLGAIGDAELVERYNRCRAVYYAPVDEDYGYATIEAFTAGKPVLTTDDAGGVLEFVRDGVTGAVVAPRPAAIAGCLDRWYAQPECLPPLGAAGRAAIAAITWDRVVDALTSS